MLVFPRREDPLWSVMLWSLGSHPKCSLVWGSLRLDCKKILAPPTYKSTRLEGGGGERLRQGRRQTMALLLDAHYDKGISVCVINPADNEIRWSCGRRPRRLHLGEWPRRSDTKEPKMDRMDGRPGRNWQVKSPPRYADGRDGKIRRKTEKLRSWSSRNSDPVTTQ